MTATTHPPDYRSCPPTPPRPPHLSTLQLFSQQVSKKKKCVLKLEEPPAKGTLDLHQIAQAPYFFS